MRQKDKNIRAEMKAGIDKNYMPVGMSLAVISDSQQEVSPQGAVRLSMTTGSVERNQSPQPIFAEVVDIGNTEPSLEAGQNEPMH